MQFDGETVRAGGEIDFSTCGKLDEMLRTLDLAAPALVDLSAVSFIDSSGLALLIEHNMLRADERGRLTILHPSKSVRRLLQMTGLEGLFQVVTE